MSLATSLGPLEADLQALYEAKKKYRGVFGMPNYPIVVRASITTTLNRLQKFQQDAVIIIPMVSGMSMDSTLHNLQELDLPFSTGVIITLDQLQTINHEWLAELESRLKTVKSRFTFVRIFYSSCIPPHKWLNQAAMDIERGLTDSLFRGWKQFGLKGLGEDMYTFYIVREESRILVKHISCRYVVWFDADTRPPLDVLNRLLNIIEGPTKADLAAGYYYDRAFPFDEPSFEPVEPIEPETAEDRAHIELCSTTMNKVNVEVKPGIWVSPYQLKRMHKPIEIRWVGGGCQLMKKQVNDEVSFFQLFPSAEDVDFCLAARRKGYRLFLDPQCFCGHDAE